MDKAFVPRWSSSNTQPSLMQGPRPRTATHSGGSGIQQQQQLRSHHNSQARPRTASASSALGSFGTKDLVLGPGGAMGRVTSTTTTTTMTNGQTAGTNGNGYLPTSNGNSSAWGNGHSSSNVWGPVTGTNGNGNASAWGGSSLQGSHQGILQGTNSGTTNGTNGTSGAWGGSPVQGTNGNGNVWGAAPAHPSASAAHPGFHQGRRGERRERHTSQNGIVAPAWRAPASVPAPAPAPAPARQQPWPQLNSSTLGAFKPLVTSPSSEGRPTFPEPAETEIVEPVSFENNFPSLGNAPGPAVKNAPVVAPSKPRVAWGKPDVVSIVAAPPQNNGSRSEGDNEIPDDDEAAEIARLKALIPKLDKPKLHGKSISLRERSKSVGKIPPIARAATYSKAMPTRSVAKPNFTSPPVMISNRPKLRSSMKASPRTKGSFPQPVDDSSGSSTSSSRRTSLVADEDFSDTSNPVDDHDDDIFPLDPIPSTLPPLSTPSSRSTTPTSIPSTPTYSAKDDVYSSTFQYSASLEKEEQFLRTLGWDKRDYYDEGVDESEFVITEEEKKEFFERWEVFRVGTC
ncbi:uncharacterized protein SPPG_00884 [Spizellomyces punctatus DAOM BR117]|uniref:Uncharacterized protein n=1 Tax=Spizellomyces punctatus (strain DAOM BR117) TaxID=645134 RepID=A0A0L0HPQ4_SPIPD|nr:uncharacterized protein SPPG_00884 [Spizellomyces punctatus DAOM BR117]KND03396.1 hypothetical protein SPPG_00884 [Spizellomyces punctatus DAOM BR117]|eukprot:XP_016611435.1 hypothetical protein SPPG_00884 [Spizellomyces punctatus DAOM BR117]